MTITASALADVRRHAAAEDETGGILLGHEHPTEIAITTAGDPGPNAQHAPAAFRRDLTHAQHLADHAYHQERAVWVGEWHTHPCGPNRPSPRDVATYRGFLTDPELDFEIVVALIVSPKPRPAVSRPANSHSATGRHAREPCAPAHGWVVHAWVVDAVNVAATPLHLRPDPPAT